MSDQQKIQEMERRIADLERLTRRGQVNPFVTFGLPANPGSDCLFEQMTPEERSKPLGLVCQCRRCSPFSLGVLNG
jgi:hypothetical protein